MKNNIHIYPSDFSANSSRLIKETNSILEYSLVDRIIFIVKKQEGINLYKNDNSKLIIKRISSGFLSKNKIIYFEAIRFLLFYLKIFIYLFRKDCSYINAHSIHVLPISVFIKIIKRKSILIYDPHELETEVAGAIGIKRKVAKIVEKFFIKWADKVIVVSPSIKTWYINEYKCLNSRNIYVIRNVPKKQNEESQYCNLFRKEYLIPEDEIIFLYQGNISRVRGCNKIVDIFKNLEGKHIVFMGNGDEYVQEVINLSKKHVNIHYKKAVDFNTELPKYTSSADIGLHFIEVNNVLNHKYCLPNKLFEYILSGIPVIVNSNAVEMNRIVEMYKIGFGIDTDNIDIPKVKAIIKNITLEDIKNYKKGISRAQEELYWENDAQQYIDIFS